MSEKEKKEEETPTTGGGAAKASANAEARKKLDDIFADVAKDAENDIKNPDEFLKMTRQSGGQ